MLIGGSKSEVKEKYIHGFFHEDSDVDTYTASASKQAKLRILPAFEESKRGTKEFSLSYAPYRDREMQDPATREPSFNPFYIPVTGYTFFGNNKLSFLSELSHPGVSSFRGGVDPVNDIFRYCNNSSDNSIKKLTQRAGSDKSAITIAPRPRKFALFNAYMEDPVTQETGNKILIITNMGKDKFLRSLSLRAGRGDEVISKDWEEFLYGDVTDPATGSAVAVRAAHLEDNPTIKFGGLFLSNKDGYLDGREAWPLDMEKDGFEILQGRYDIADDSAITRICSYAEILDMIVADGLMPYHIIERACKPHADIPAAPKGVVTSQPDLTNVQQTTSSPTTEEIETPKAESATPAEEVTESVTEEPKSSQVAMDQPNLNEEETAKFKNLHTRYEADDSSLDGSELAEYFSLRVKSGQQF
jgi:hypothetical protein